MKILRLALLLSVGCSQSTGTQPQDGGSDTRLRDATDSRRADAARCGNGRIDPGETCDGDCPSRCNDSRPCTIARLIGSAATCDAECTTENIGACVGDDQCCPSSCDQTTDSDCRGQCGNGRVEMGEVCDGNCPASCDDANACTADTRSGSPTLCNVSCGHVAISSCRSGDGCCPAGCTNATDRDCSATCGNGIRETGETCDGDCPTQCADDGDLCTIETFTGMVENCTARCSRQRINTPESDAQLCTASGRVCGVTSLTDSCGARRTVTCGTCPPVANGDSVCQSDGTCHASCRTDYHECGGACVSDLSALTCGSRCSPCPSTANGSPTCDGTSCGMRCHSGFRPCVAGCCAWVAETLATGYVDHASIALDVAGSPHVVYWRSDGAELRHAQRTGATWTFSTIVQEQIGTQTDLAFDSRGVLHLVSYGRYLTYQGGAWTEHERFTGSRASGYGPKLLIDAADTVHVAYLLNGLNSPIQYATRVAGGWTIESVETNVGGYYLDELDAEFSASGQPALFYRTNDAYHFATRSPTGVWSIETVAVQSRNYSTVSIQRTATGFALVYPQRYAELWIAEGTPGSWSTSHPASGWGVLAQAPVGDIRLAYNNYTSIDNPTTLMVRTRVGAGWRAETVRSGSGSVTDAVVDSGGSLWFVEISSTGLWIYH